MNEFDIETHSPIEVSEKTDITENIDFSEDIEVDGESFHIEEFEPTEEEYRELVGGIYKSFYTQDIKNAVDKAIEEKRGDWLAYFESEIQKKEQSIREETRKDIIKKISQRRLRPDENGLSGQHSNPKRDVSKMTKEERALAAKRAAGGLIINLK